MRSRLPKLTYANVVATLALFIALGGVSWAAVKLPKNSVGTPQIKDAAVTNDKIKKNSITGAKIKADTITSADIAAGAVGSGDIDVAGLPKVPSAARADTADDSEKLIVKTSTVTGFGASEYDGFLAATEVPLLDIGQLHFFAKCYKGTDTDAVDAYIGFTTSGVGGFVSTPNVGYLGNRIVPGSNQIVRASQYNGFISNSNDKDTTLVIGTDGYGAAISAEVWMNNSYSGTASDVFPSSESCIYKFKSRTFKL